MLARLRVLLPTDAWCRFLLAPVIVFMATAMDRHYLTDFWHHLARGRAIAEQGELLNKDIFTFTVADEPLQDNNWLTQLLYHWLYQQGGLDLVIFVNSLVLAVVFAILIALCRRASATPLAASGLGVLTFLGMWQVLIVRPQTFSFLLFVVLYAIMLGAERRRWLLALPPFVLALWANVHGGFPIGLVLVGAFLMGQIGESWLECGRGVVRDRRVWALGICLVLCLLATLVNPYGWNLYRYVMTTSSRAAQRRIDEWVPPGAHLFIGKVFILSLVGLIAIFGWVRSRPRARDICLAICFLPLAMSSVRMVAWWLMAIVPVMAGLLARSATVHEATREQGADAARSPEVGAAGYCAVLLGALVLSLPWLEGMNPLNIVRGTHRDEMDLEEVARQLPEGDHRIFSRFEWGEYLGWRLAPHGRVFMDGRIEIYPDDVWSEYMTLTFAGPSWQEILDRHGVDCLILDTSYHQVLIEQVRQSPEWRELDPVGKAIVFHRVTP
jgi:hypothetical protein